MKSFMFRNKIMCVVICDETTQTCCLNISEGDFVMGRSKFNSMRLLDIDF